MQLFIAMILASIVTMNTIGAAHAVPPPEFLIAISSSLGLVFSFLVIIFSSVTGAVVTVFKSFFARFQNKKLFWGITAVVIILLSLGISFAILAVQ